MPGIQRISELHSINCYVANNAILWQLLKVRILAIVCPTSRCLINFESTMGLGNLEMIIL